MSAVWLAIGLIVLACVAFYWWTQAQKAAKQRMQDQVMGRKKITAAAHLPTPSRNWPKFMAPVSTINAGNEKQHSYADDGGLLQRATQAKLDGDWSAAIELLKQAKHSQGDAFSDTKLALYLQQAGRFDEAMDEFNWLLSMAKWQCWTSIPHAPEVVRHASYASKKALIHDKIRVACNRQKEAVLATFHEGMRDDLRDEAQKLETKCKAAYAADERDRLKAQKMGLKAIEKWSGQKEQSIQAVLKEAASFKPAGL